jgi:hypothetical protein
MIMVEIVNQKIIEVRPEVTIWEDTLSDGTKRRIATGVTYESGGSISEWEADITSKEETPKRETR